MVVRRKVTETVAVAAMVDRKPTEMGTKATVVRMKAMVDTKATVAERKATEMGRKATAIAAVAGVGSG